jgi:hypothetical protein
VAAFAIEYNAPTNLNLKLQTLTGSIAVAVFEKSKQKKKHIAAVTEKNTTVYVMGLGCIAEGSENPTLNF